MRKFAITTAIALLGTAMVSLPASAGPQASPSDEISAQAGTKGAGATRSGSGPGTNMGDPGISSATGPGANPVTQPPMRHTTRHHRKVRTTTGSR